jgi:hypothetical protein
LPRGSNATTRQCRASNSDATARGATWLHRSRAQIPVLAASIGEQLETYPDAAVFTSLPRSGTVRAARLLAEIGDARGRFPTPDSLACLAGVAPSTRQSGKVKSVIFRWGADKQLRDTLCDFAADSRHIHPCAARLYEQARARGHDHPHAVRVLARAWVHVIWRCWQDNVPYTSWRLDAEGIAGIHPRLRFGATSCARLTLPAWVGALGGSSLGTWSCATRPGQALLSLRHMSS